MIIGLAQKNGLSLYKRKEGLFRKFQKKTIFLVKSLSHNYTFYIHEDKQTPGVLWIGTAYGLNKIR